MKKTLIALLVALCALTARQSFAQVVSTQSVAPAATSGAWTSATSNNTAITATVTGMARVLVTLHSTSTMTAGTLNFEASDQAGTTFNAINGRRVGGSSITGAMEATFALSATDEVWAFDVAGFTSFRVRLNPVIAGSGTATVAILPTSAAVVTETTVVQPTGSRLQVQSNSLDLATQTTAAAAAASLATIDDIVSGAGINVTQLGSASTPMTTTQADGLANTLDGLNTTAFGYVFNGTTWDRAQGSASNGLLVNLGTNNDVDTELPTAAALADSTSNPTLPAVAAYFMAYNGTTWDRAQLATDNSQGSTTSGQKGPLIQCAVTTSAPSYTTAQTSPASCTTAGLLRVAVEAGGGTGGTSSTFGSSTPATGTAVGMSDGTNMVALLGTTTQADNLANTLDSLNTSTFAYWFDGSTWDRARGDSTDGLLVNLGANNDVVIATGSAQIGHLEANQSVNIAQMNGVTTTMGNGVSGTGVQRVTIASDSTGVVGLAAGTAQIGHLEANQSSNVAQINGVTPSMGNGASGTGVQRVTIANDSTGIVGLTTGTAQIGHLEANQSTNTAQINGVTPLMGAGNTGTGSPRVTIATDQAALAGMGVGATAAAPPANANYIAGITSGATGGLLSGGIPVCDQQQFLDMTTATTTELVALTSGRTIHVCHVRVFSNGATTFTFKRGTGTNCGTGTTSIDNAIELTAQTGYVAGTGVGEVLNGGASANALCVTNSATVNLHVFVRYAVY